MAEYLEVNKQFKRMCSIYQSKRCSGCPMGSVNISQCRKKAFECPKAFEDIVMQWAKQNPEPVYPTLAEVAEQYWCCYERQTFHGAEYTDMCISSGHENV